MGPPAFAGDDIWQAIAIDVRQGERVQLRELYARNFRVRIFGKNDMRTKIDGSIRRADLFKPGEPVAVGMAACDDIGETVAIHIRN